MEYPWVFSPQFISSVWSLQSSRPSQTTAMGTHCSLCWQANWPGWQRFLPPEGEVTLLGVTSSSAIQKKKIKGHTLQQLNLKNYFSTEKKKMKLITSSAAEDLNTQVERVSELHGNDAQVASPDKPAEPAGHRGPTHHPYFKHLHHDNKKTRNIKHSSPICHLFLFIQHKNHSCTKSKDKVIGSSKIMKMNVP